MLKAFLDEALLRAGRSALNRLTLRALPLRVRIRTVGWTRIVLNVRVVDLRASVLTAYFSW